jgi:Domain of unknown function (DUF5664)
VTNMTYLTYPSKDNALYMWLGEEARDYMNSKYKFQEDNPMPQDTCILGRKADIGKAQIYKGVLQQFPLAISEIAKLSEHGAEKYSWENWKIVDNAISRYSDALMRHLLEEAKDNDTDPESGFYHAVHTAWNALARLELLLDDEKHRELWAMSPEVDEITDSINSSQYLSPINKAA